MTRVPEGVGWTALLTAFLPRMIGSGRPAAGRRPFHDPDTQ